MTSQIGDDADVDLTASARSDRKIRLHNSDAVPFSRATKLAIVQLRGGIDAVARAAHRCRANVFHPVP